ncbi:MAG TPA: SLBB domain-containing protein [Steroidobacteraceae bacterium]|nr:SLBB domain-containing protein [Steroidobacteraceae bacterium]
MSAKSRLAAFGLGALALVNTGATVAQTPSAAEIQAFQSLPAEQQQTLMQQFLGVGGAGTGLPPGVTYPSAGQAGVSNATATTPRYPLPSGPITVVPEKTWGGRFLRQPNEDPELRADDTVLLYLSPSASASGCSGGANAPMPLNSQALATGIQTSGAQMLGAQTPGAQNPGTSAGPVGTTSPCNSSSGRNASRSAGNRHSLRGGEFRRPIDAQQRRRQMAALRRRILDGNPYRLSRYGALEIPGLPAVPLAGLTQMEAGARLSSDPDLRDFTVTLTLLRLKPIGEAALKPFGYDLFENPPSTFAPVENLPVPPGYVVGPGDSLDVQLYGSEQANYVLQIERDGRINFPKLGPIMVSGMPFDAARATIERRVAQALIGTRVSVTMSNLRTIQVFVLGEAKHPGSYTVGGLSTMTDALFASGGIRKAGSLRNIELKRNGRLVTVLDLYDLLLRGDTSGDRQLQPGDVIFIPPIGRTAAIDGAVRRPAIYELKNENTIGRLIAMAGGLLPDADQTLVHIERIAPSRAFEMLDVNLATNGGLDAPLADGDRVTVPAILPTLEDSVQLTGYVYRPGAFEYRPGLRLSDVIPSFEELRPNADSHYIMIRRIVPPDEHVEVVSADLERALAERGSAADPLLEPRDKIYVFDLSASRTRLIRPIIKTLELQATPDHPAAIVTIDGQVKAPGRYALEPGMRVSDLIRAGGSLDDAAFGGEAELTRYRIVAGEARESRLIKVDLDAIRRGDAAADLELKPYDVLVVKTVPQWRTPGTIEVAGEVRFPGRYPIHQGETLRSLLIRAGGFVSDAFPQGAVLTRAELKIKEKAELDLLATRFQNDLTALSLSSVAGSSTGTSAGAVAAAGATQGLLVGQQLLNELRTTKPVGRLVVNLRRIMRGPPGGPADVTLRNGDFLFVPKKTQEVTILGEVQNPTSQLYRRDWSRDQYIERSGGLTQNADKKRIYVVRANGDVVGADRTGWFRRSQSVEMRPGDTIVVPLNADRIPALPLWTAATTILYNIAIAVLALKNL